MSDTTEKSELNRLTTDSNPTPTNSSTTVAMSTPSSGRSLSMTSTQAICCPGAPRKRSSVDSIGVSSEARVKLDFSKW